MKFQTNKKEIPGTQKWSSKQTKIRFHVYKNEVPIKQKRGSR